MNERSANSSPAREQTKPVLSSPMFDHERLDVYHLELQFIAWVTDLLEGASKSAEGRTAEACDQLDRASLSALLNTAGGNGKRQRQGRARFFDDARGSTTECAACLDALVAKRATTEERILEGKKMLGCIVSMLCGLVDRFDAQGKLKDEPIEGYFNGPEEKVSYKTKKSRTKMKTRARKNK